MDVFYLALAIGFFAVSATVVSLFDRLRRR